MLQTSFLVQIASLLADAATFSEVRLGTGSAVPTKNDLGLKGSTVITVPTEVAQSETIVTVTTGEFVFSTGTVQEIGFFGSDGQMKDRLIFSPIDGGLSTRLQVEYQLEPIVNG